MSKNKYKFAWEDRGNHRVYYRHGRQLYCWQDDGSWGKSNWTFYICSSDGEPSHEANFNETAPCPDAGC